MNKKLVAFLLASSMVFQAGIASFAAELSNGDSEKTVTVNSESGERTVNKEDLTEKQKEESKKTEEDSKLDSSENGDSKRVEETVVDKKEIQNSEADNFIKKTPIVKRIAGDDRVQTSIEISKFEATKAEKVILADASNYPDALSASTLADGKYPVLLIQNKLTEGIKEEIKRLGAKEVIVLGGENSISNSIEKELKTIDNISKVTRISGADRFETSSKIYLESGKKKAVVASGENFPDALASSSLLKDSGLLLTKKNSIPKAVEEIINSAEGRIEVIGGQGSIGNSFYKQLSPTVKYETISGSDRYSTSVEIAKRLNSEVAIIASGENFPDALAASTLSQKISAPILLVAKDKIPNSVVKYIQDKQIKKAIVLGGEGSISKNTADNVERAIMGKDTIEENTKPVEDNTQIDTSNIKKSAVTKSDVALYTDEQLSQEAGKLPKNKIVDVLEDKDTLAKVRYDKTEGWINKQNLKPYEATSFGKVVNNVPYISQLYPVYAPNGCEPTSMLMGLKGKGYTDIGLREYLDKMPKSKSNPKYGYVGVPYNVEAGRFQTIDPEPLARYGRQYGNVVNIQGAPIEDVIKEIQNGNTVVLYATLYWNKPYYKTLTVDGKPMRRIWNNHVILLTGYDPVKKSFYIADPYNHEKAGGNRRKPFYYWKSQSAVDTAYNYDNRRFAVAIR